MLHRSDWVRLKWLIAGVATLVLGALGIASCVLLATYDRRERISFKLLLDAEGIPSTAVYEAAINAKFPAGTPSSDVVAFVQELGGSCERLERAKQYRCLLPYEATFCLVRSVVLVFDSTSPIDHIAVGSWIDGC